MSDAPAPQGGPSWPSGPSGPRNGMGTAALVLGLLGLALSFFIVGGVLGLIAVVLGVLALGRVRKGQANNRGVAIGGIVAGVLAILVAVVVGIFVADNADEIEDLGDCLEDANTEQERDDCAQRFEDEVDVDN